MKHEKTTQEHSVQNEYMTKESYEKPLLSELGTTKDIQNGGPSPALADPGAYS